ELAKELDHIRHTVIHASDEINSVLESLGESPLTGGVSAEAMLKRPNVRYKDLLPFIHPQNDAPSSKVQQKAEIEIKYEGYLKRQSALAEKLGREDSMELPEDIDYKQIRGLRLEAADKLNRIRPSSFGQASRISGVNPADLQVLSVWLAKNRRAADRRAGDDK
ncbi:MAG: tRNA uridine-5-carboxymethylaminomethyl(34) synthesis enzyme MnmG, partial [Oscillospiraceae bacterium]|nr:tRNA uridine-5-carboxymethylaminomethyl(34) synthesis enzyme MnmG [Oscillospiraceae bacterium]